MRIGDTDPRADTELKRSALANDQGIAQDHRVIGISGIDEDGSLLEFDYQEVRVAQALIRNSRQVLLACDHTKFGRHAMIHLGDVSDVNLLVTDRQPEPQFTEMLRERGVKTLIASQETKPDATQVES